MRRLWANPSAMILLAPLLFWIHIMEEASFGFMRWYNSVMTVHGSESGFLTANLEPLLITALLAAAVVWLPRKEPAFLLLVWLSYFMFANTIFHVTATLALGRYCPGLVTALMLYLPFYCWYTRYLGTRFSMHPATIAIVSLLAVGVVYVQWHGPLFKN